MKLMIALALVLAGVAQADQIERETHEITTEAPAAVMVKVNPEAKTVSVYQVPDLDPSLKADASQLKKVSALFEVEANKVGEFAISTNELDREGSTPAWYGRWWGGWRWNNWCGWNSGYRWNQPYYNPGYFGWNNYSYAYRYSYSYNYGYNNGCNYGWYW